MAPRPVSPSVANSLSPHKEATATLDSGLIELIRRMASNNRTWGCERIRGELLKLGFRVSKRKIQRYVRSIRSGNGRAQTWKTFLQNHQLQIWACDFLRLYDFAFRPIFAFFIVHHGSRRVVHFNVTRNRRTSGLPSSFAKRCRSMTALGSSSETTTGSLVASFTLSLSAPGRRSSGSRRLAKLQRSLRAVSRQRPPRMPGPHPDPQR